MEFFRFTRGERIASLVILAVTVILAVWLYHIRRVVPLPDPEARRFDSLAAALQVVTDTPVHAAMQKRPEGRGDAVPPEVRDPNTMTREEWESLGVPPRLVTTILHYREAGGRFRKKEDLRRIYGMHDSIYRRIAPWLRVTEERDSSRGQSAQEVTRLSVMKGKQYTSPPVVELNSADSATLDSLPGVPSWLARRMVRYRELLGGYARMEQLLEVYGLDSARYERLKGYLRIDTTLLRKIDINSCDWQTLARHPYLDRRQARAILFFRDRFGPVDSLGALKEQKVLPPDVYRRIRPYLSCGKRR